MPHRAALALALLATQAGAETFRVTLGGDALGTLAFAVEGEGEARRLSLEAAFANTPLGVADGTFRATSAPVRLEDGVGLQYLSESAFSRRARTVSVLLADGRAVGTTVSPADDRTDLSEPAAVPEGVIDPAEAFGRLLVATACPGPFRVYDGRRVAEVSTAPVEAENASLACEGTYRVVAGPAHLSPIGIESFDLRLLYDAAGLAEVGVSTGPFTLRLVR